MLSPLRNRFGNRPREPFGKAGLTIAVIALVFAMLGGAYAASDNSGGKATASAKAKRGPRGPKGATGPAGPAGPAGLAGAKGDAGAAGANGKDGTNGSNGTNGAPGAAGANGNNGKTILNGTTNPTNAIGTQGDFYINTTSDEIFGPKPSNAGAWGAGTALKGTNGAPGAPGADGADGSPWVVGTAPAGVIMKGTWSVAYNAAAANETVPVAISTGVPVNHFLPPGVVKPGVNLPGQEEEDRELLEVVCPGSASSPLPSALDPPIALCVYVQEDVNLKPPADADLRESGGGGVLQFKSAAAGVARAYGSWVLTTE